MFKLKHIWKKKPLFDRDNTLIKDKGYTHLRKDLIFLPGVIKGLNFLKKIIISRLYLLINLE